MLHLTVYAVRSNSSHLPHHVLDPTPLDPMAGQTSLKQLKCCLFFAPGVEEVVRYGQLSAGVFGA